MKIDRTALYLFGLVARLVPNDSDSTGAKNCDSMNQSQTAPTKQTYDPHARNIPVNQTPKF